VKTFASNFYRFTASSEERIADNFGSLSFAAYQIFGRTVMKCACGYSAFMPLHILIVRTTTANGEPQGGTTNLGFAAE